MAVTTIVQDILDGAYSKSTQNQPGQIATESVELVELVTRLLRGLYSFAAAINPIHFAVKVPVTGVASVWARPENAEAVIRIETLAFAEVSIVPYDDRLADNPNPSVYEFARVFTASEGQTTPPAPTVVLDFWCSKRPVDPSPFTTSGVLDPDWQEDFNELLVLEVAIFLAIKDGRAAEAEQLKQERNAWASRFASYLQHATPGLKRRFGHRRHVDVETLLPLLAGGA